MTAVAAPADRISPAEYGRGVLRVFRREWTVWAPDWPRNLVFITAESLVTAIAFGVLLAKYVTLPGGQRYIDFIAPALAVAVCLQAVTSEGLYVTRANLHDRKLFESMLTAPLSPRQVVLGHLCWHGFRACLAGTVLTCLFLALGAKASATVLLLPPLMAICGPAFSAPAMLWASLSPKLINLQYFNTLAIVPMYFLSGIFFPVQSLPTGLRQLIEVSPLYHAATVSRGLFAGDLTWGVAGHLLVFLVMASVGILAMLARFDRQLGR